MKSFINPNMTQRSNQTVGMFDSVDHQGTFPSLGFSPTMQTPIYCFQDLIPSKVTGSTVKRLPSPACRAPGGTVLLGTELTSEIN
jgi:hypothetical protein